MSAKAQEPFFLAQLDQAALFRVIVDAVKEVLNDAVFDCSPTGIELQAMDTYHVALVSLRLDAAGFDAFTCTSPLALHLDFTHLSRALRMCGAADRLTLSTLSPDATKATLTLQGANRVSSFDLQQLNIATEPISFPHLDFDATVSMPSKEFASIIKDLGAFGTDGVILSATKDSIAFQISSDSTSGSIVFSPSDDPTNLTTITATGEPRQEYTLKYLAMFTKATTLSQSVTLSFSSHRPLLVTYSIEDAGHMRYLLAPKLDEAGDDGDDGDDSAADEL